jgi:AMMECR1 domain-containing protein
MAFTITPGEQKILLSDARESIASKLEGRRPGYENEDRAGLVLKEPCGAFVTLHKTEAGGGGHNLRG